MTTILSPMVIASTWSWVTYIKVVFNLLWSLVISLRICVRSFASRFDNGSSRRNTLGLRTIALPSATLCLWPPLIAPGFLPRYSSSPRIFAISITRV